MPPRRASGTARDHVEVVEVVEVVVPTIGRASLQRALEPLVGRVPVIVVDDRPAGGPDLGVPEGVRVLRSGGRGPAAARNVGWRASSATWVAFLDDDVEPEVDWPDALLADVVGCAPDVAGSQGRIVVPLPADRPPSDWERSTVGLEHAVWATADLAYRREALVSVGGFDERFPRAYREDADLGLRVVQQGWRIEQADRWVRHPVREAPWFQSLRSQRGNADDVLMRRKHGADWRRLAHVPSGRRAWHLATSACVLGAAGIPRLRMPLALLATALTTELTVQRVRPGPRTAREVASMVITSVALPHVASWHWLRAWAERPGRA